MIDGEGNGNPLQCSCLENPMDREAWSAAVHGVAQSWTRLSDLASAAAARDSYGNLFRSQNEMRPSMGLYLRDCSPLVPEYFCLPYSLHLLNLETFLGYSDWESSGVSSQAMENMDSFQRLEIGTSWRVTWLSLLTHDVLKRCIFLSHSKYNSINLIFTKLTSWVMWFSFRTKNTQITTMCSYKITRVFLCFSHVVDCVHSPWHYLAFFLIFFFI